MTHRHGLTRFRVTPALALGLLIAGCAAPPGGEPADDAATGTAVGTATGTATGTAGRSSSSTTPTRPAAPTAPAPPSFTQPIPGTAVSIEMVGVPSDRGQRWMSKTEITWDAYDVFVYRLDSPTGAPTTVQAVTRPSKPYIAMDRGFGHAGYPAISMSYEGARVFCLWLSAKTGRIYRLPTDAEWTRVCALAAIDPSQARDYAWYAANADRSTHPAGSARPDALGLHDLWGNASEWCTGADGAPVTRGGTFLDDLDAIGCAASVPPTREWNASDPQFPKSTWWLADGGFVGFRIVCEADDDGAMHDEATNARAAATENGETP